MRGRLVGELSSLDLYITTHAMLPYNLVVSDLRYTRFCVIMNLVTVSTVTAGTEIVTSISYLGISPENPFY